MTGKSVFGGGEGSIKTVVTPYLLNGGALDRAFKLSSGPQFTTGSCVVPEERTRT